MKTLGRTGFLFALFISLFTMSVFAEEHYISYEIIDSYNDLVVVKDGGYFYAVSDLDNNIVIDFKYDDLSLIPYGDGLIIAEEVDKYGVINRNNETIIPFEYDRIYCFDENRIFAYCKDEKKLDAYSLNGELVFSKQLDVFLIGDNLHSLTNGLYCYYEKAAGATVENPLFRYQIIDENGNEGSCTEDFPESSQWDVSDIDFLPWNPVNSQNYLFLYKAGGGGFVAEIDDKGFLDNLKDVSQFVSTRLYHPFAGFDEKGDFVFRIPDGDREAFIIVDSETLEKIEDIHYYNQTAELIDVSRVDNDKRAIVSNVFNRNDECVCTTDDSVYILDHAYATYNGMNNAAIYNTVGERLYPDRLFDMTTGAKFFVAGDSKQQSLLIDQNGNLIGEPGTFSMNTVLFYKSQQIKHLFETEDNYGFQTDSAVILFDKISDNDSIEHEEDNQIDDMSDETIGINKSNNVLDDSFDTVNTYIGSKEHDARNDAIDMVNPTNSNDDELTDNNEENYIEFNMEACDDEYDYIEVNDPEKNSDIQTSDTSVVKPIGENSIMLDYSKAINPEDDLKIVITGQEITPKKIIIKGTVTNISIHDYTDVILCATYRDNEMKEVNSHIFELSDNIDAGYELDFTTDIDRKDDITSCDITIVSADIDEEDGVNHISDFDNDDYNDKKWVATVNLGKPNNYTGGPYQFILVQPVDGIDIRTEIESGKTIHEFPYTITLEGEKGIRDGLIYLYEKVDEEYEPRVTWPVTFNVVMSDVELIHEKGFLSVGVIEQNQLIHQDNNGNWVGFNVDLFNLIAHDLDVKPEFVQVSKNYYQQNLIDQKIDCVCSEDKLFQTKTNNLDIVKPYLRNAKIIVMPKGKNTTCNNIDDLKQLHVSIGGSISDDQTAKDYDLQYIAYVDQSNAVYAMLKGNSDAAMIDLLNFDSLFDADIAQDYAINTELSNINYSICCKKGSGLTSLINNKVEELYSNGMIDIIAEKNGVTSGLIEDLENVTNNTKIWSTVVNSSCNLRNGPGYDYDVIGTVENESEISVIGDIVDGWWHVLTDNQEGYIREKFIN